MLQYKKIKTGTIAGIIILVIGSLFGLVSNPKTKTNTTTPAQESKPAQKAQDNRSKEDIKTVKNEKSFQEAIQDSSINVNAKSIAKSARCIDRYSLLEDNEEWDKQAEEYGSLAFAKNCIYHINYKMNKISYTEVDFDTFAEVINQTENNICKYCRLTFSKGVIVTADLLNGNYMDGISYEEKNIDQSWYETVLENKLYNSYIKLSSIEADIAESNGIETIEVYTDQKKGNAETGMIIVKNSQGKILYSEKTDIKKSALINESINLGTLNETDFLMTVHIEDRDVYGVCAYEIFRLDDKGYPLPIAGSSFTFDDNYPFSKTAFQKWAKEMDSYYNATKPLVIKKENEIITDWNKAKRNKYHDAISGNLLPYSQF